MEIIACYNCSDFDTLASMIAAKKVYPEALLVFSGTFERTIREFISIHRGLVSFTSFKDIPVESITKLIIVDTRIPQRLGPVKKVIDNPNIDIHVYDHHPCRLEDIIGTVNMVKAVGSTTTILVEIIKRHHISISPVEATLFALGIYQDTGSLTYPSTTPLDIDMASYLLTRGAKLDVVARYINYPLSESQRNLLNKLILSSRTYNFEGFQIIITTSEVEDYIRELALISYKMLELERKDAFFCIVRMKDKVYIVARSSEEAIDVSLVARAFGGGGHAAAASAIIKERDLKKVKLKILETLKKNIKPALLARDIMSFPVKTVEENLKVGDAMEIIREHGHSGLIIEKKGNLCGIISLKILKKAAEHKLLHAPVKAYMIKDFVTAPPDMPVSMLQEKMVEKQVGRIPIISDDRLVGVVTRSDILRTIHGNSLYTPQQFPANIESMANVPTLFQKLLRKAGKLGNREKIPVYAVGGFVRDLILKKENLDLDIVVEGEGISYAEKLSDLIGGELKTHSNFGTAEVRLEGDYKVDVASARAEFYTQPGALPKIRYASIKQDLFRRDFTINAMALGLNSDNFGQIIDFFRGKKDLESGLIRVLHNLSFIDDPTRIFRAIKFEQRYYFTIEPHTERLIKEAINEKNILSEITIERIVYELIMILSEERPVSYIKRLGELDILKIIHPHIKVDKRMIETLNEAVRIIDVIKTEESNLTSWLVYFMILTGDLPPKTVKKIGKKLKLKSEFIQKMTFITGHCPNLSYCGTIYPSEIYSALNELSIEFLIYTMAQTRNSLVRNRISNYIYRWRKVDSPINGKDLINMGYKPGPLFSQAILSSKNDAMDGLVNSREEAMEKVKDIMIE